MSTIINFGVPAHGHVNPSLPVLRELVRRDEQVVSCNTEEFRPQIEATGATFFPYPATDLTAAAISTALGHKQIGRFMALMAHATEKLLPWARDELSRQRPDLVVFDSTAVWGKAASTLGNLPTTAFFTHFVLAGAKKNFWTPGAVLQVLGLLLYLPALASVYLRLGSRYGRRAFPLRGRFLPLRGDLNLVFAPRELQPDTPVIDFATLRSRLCTPSVKTRSSRFSAV